VFVLILTLMENNGKGFLREMKWKTEKEMSYLLQSKNTSS